MKNKKFLIIILLITIIACVVGGILYCQKSKRDTEEYDDYVKKYERIEKISNQVNDEIDKEVSKANEFIATNPEVGEDKSSINELTNMVTELESLKIEIEPKRDTAKEVNNAIEKMENQIKQVDEELLNTENEELNFSENSNFKTLTSNIAVLTEKVNESVAVETERKAEAERIAQEEKIINGDLSIFAGTYTYTSGGNYTEKLTLEADGSIKNNWQDNFKYSNDGKPVSIKKNTDGTYTIEYSFYSEYGVAMINEGWNSHEYTLAPVGVRLEDYDDEYNSIDTDTNRVRIRDELYDAGPGNIFYKD